MKDVVVFCLIVLEILISASFTMDVLIYTKDNSYTIITLKDFVVELFSKSNWFGYLLDIILLIILLPAILLILIVDICFVLIRISKFLWNLGRAV